MPQLNPSITSASVSLLELNPNSPKMLLIEKNFTYLVLSLHNKQFLSERNQNMTLTFLYNSFNAVFTIKAKKLYILLIKLFY